MESGSVTEVSTGFNYVEDDLTKRKCFCDLCRTDERTGVGDDYDNEKISYHDKTEALEAELTISNYNVHIRILYGIISILLVLILYGFWSQRQDMATLRSECLTDSRPFSVQNFGSVFNNSDLYLSGPGNRIRQKRHAIGSMQNLQNQVSYFYYMNLIIDSIACLLCPYTLLGAFLHDFLRFTKFNKF